jgi:hypothetical protein
MTRRAPRVREEVEPLSHRHPDPATTAKAMATPTTLHAMVIVAPATSVDPGADTNPK